MEIVTIKDVVNFIKKKIYIVLVSILLIVLLGIFYTCAFKKPVYEAQVASVLNVGILKQDTNDMNISTDAVAINRELLNTYIEIIKSEKIANLVIGKLQLDCTSQELKGKVEVENEENSQFINMKVKANSAEEAIQIANTMVNMAKEEIVQLYGVDALAIIEEAKITNNAENMNLLKDIIIYFVLGAVVAMGGMVVYYYLDDTIKNVKTIETTMGLPIIARMTNIRKNKRKDEIDYNIKEILDAMLVDGLQCIAITSPENKDGKTILAQRIIQNLIRENKKVLYIRTHGEKEKETVKKNTVIDSIHVNEIIKETGLDIERCKAFIEESRKQYDFVIIDYVAVMNKDFKRQILEMADGIILVATLYVTKVEIMKKTKDLLQKANTPILGIALNKVNRNFEGYYKTDERR